MKYANHLMAGILLALSAGGYVHAQTPTSNTITIEHAWARATPGGAKTGAAYLTLINTGPAADRLLGATSPVADKIQFHKESEENGVAQMRELQTVEVAAGAKVAFKPGDMHMMMVGLKQPLKEGQTIPLVLRFEKAGNVDVTVPVAKVGAMQPGDMDGMMHGADKAMKKN
ncbi:MAG: copper chaperone PCu(A)C [Bradyrhizobium sp.]